jgi:hypothetical protein
MFTHQRQITPRIFGRLGSAVIQHRIRIGGGYTRIGRPDNPGMLNRDCSRQQRLCAAAAAPSRGMEAPDPLLG